MGTIGNRPIPPTKTLLVGTIEVKVNETVVVPGSSPDAWVMVQIVRFPALAARPFRDWTTALTVRSAAEISPDAAVGTRIVFTLKVREDRDTTSASPSRFYRFGCIPLLEAASIVMLSARDALTIQRTDTMESLILTTFDFCMPAGIKDARFVYCI